MSYLKITSTKEVIQQVEAFFKSEILSSHRNMKLSGVMHEANYSVARIHPAEEGTRIPAESIFWLGFHSGQGIEATNQQTKN